MAGPTPTIYCSTVPELIVADVTVGALVGQMQGGTAHC